MRENRSTPLALALTVTEAGNLLGVSRSTAYELVRTRELESMHLRRRVVVPVAVIAERLGITVADLRAAVQPEPAPASRHRGKGLVDV